MEINQSMPYGSFNAEESEDLFKQSINKSQQIEYLIQQQVTIY